MNPRSHFDHDLLSLRQRLLWLGETVEKAIGGAVWALLHQDMAAARRVIRGAAAIDELCYTLEEAGLELIARRQPLAGDLRLINALIGVALELERIGDYAEGISRIVLRGAGLPRPAAPPGLEAMAAQARAMLMEALHAVIERDSAVAERLERADDRVDELYRRIYAELVAVMREQPARIEAALYLLWSAHNLERIADRTVNIAERAAFIATGRLPK